jgi:hypothetical protein
MMFAPLSPKPVTIFIKATKEKRKKSAVFTHIFADTQRPLFSFFLSVFYETGTPYPARIAL